MKSLSKADIVRRDDIARSMNESWMKLKEAAEAATASIEAYNAAIETYRETLSKADGFAEDMVSSIEEYIDERSEKWQQSDAADRYAEWRDEWQTEFECELDPIVLDELDESPDAVEKLLELPIKPEE